MSTLLSFKVVMLTLLGIGLAPALVFLLSNVLARRRITWDYFDANGLIIAVVGLYVWGISRTVIIPAARPWRGWVDVAPIVILVIIDLYLVFRLLRWWRYWRRGKHVR